MTSVDQAAAAPKEGEAGRVRRLIEDLVGRTFMLTWFMFSAARQIVFLFNHLGQRTTSVTWLLDSVHNLLLLAFSLLAITLTIARRPIKSVAQGLEPRISAILGTFLVLTLPFLPNDGGNIEIKLVAIPITLMGLLLSFYCLIFLGQSYSIMAAARKLVTDGPYSVVRHPLYASEALVILGVLLGSLSLPALLIVVVTLSFQLRRTFNEERVLRATFPEYEAYARRVPRIIPRIRLFSKGQGPEPAPAVLAQQPHDDNAAHYSASH